MTRTQIAGALGCAMVLGVGAAAATPTAAEKCQADKLQAAATYTSCRLTASKTAVLRGKLTNYTTCDRNFLKAYAKAETKAAGACPTSGDAAAVQARIGGDTAAVAAESSGTAPTALRRLPASGSTTSVVAGDDGAIQAGAGLHYVDNGDGTITDVTTGLMWEKKDDDNLPGLAGLHDQDNTYPLFGTCIGNYSWAKCGVDADCGPNGPCDTSDAQGTNLTAFLWIDQLNAGSGFAGHKDWRLPNKKELESIVDSGTFNPAVDPVFNNNCGVFDGNYGSGNTGNAGCTVTTCSCTPQPGFLTSTLYAVDPTNMWVVNFDDGGEWPSPTNSGGFVRAVRGGL